MGMPAGLYQRKADIVNRGYGGWPTLRVWALVLPKVLPAGIKQLHAELSPSLLFDVAVTASLL
jgi:hypothetical protein